MVKTIVVMAVMRQVVNLETAPTQSLGWSDQDGDDAMDNDNGHGIWPRWPWCFPKWPTIIVSVAVARVSPQIGFATATQIAPKVVHNNNKNKRHTLWIPPKVVHTNNNKTPPSMIAPKVVRNINNKRHNLWLPPRRGWGQLRRAACFKSHTGGKSNLKLSNTLFRRFAVQIKYIRSFTRILG